MGEITILKPDESDQQMKLGDLVLCRVTKELVKIAYKLIKRGIRPAIKGRDIGKGLKALLDVLVKRVDVIKTLLEDPSDIHKRDRVIVELHRYRHEELGKLALQGSKAEGRIESLNDKCDCMNEFLVNSSTLEEVEQRIHTLFNDKEKPENVVTLGTVHRTKGLESERIFVLAPDMIPHPAAKNDWQILQERNLAWVAVTRAKYDNAKGTPGTIFFCGMIPPIFNEVKKS